MPIKFQDVHYIYSPKTPFSFHALKGIDLEVKEGSFLAIVGRTGCGKSTLIQHMNALLNPTSGSVDIDDFHNVSDKKKRSKKVKDLRQKVGMVFQFPEYQLFEETVEKDVAFAPKNFGFSKEESIERAHKALAELGLDESFYERSPFELSGGEKRRVAIAGVLGDAPSFLVVDEPTAGLDPAGARKLMELFKKVHASGTTVVLVTHDMDVVMDYCDRVIVIDDGKVALDLTPHALFEMDIEPYSLQSPSLHLFASRLAKRGLTIPKEKTHDIGSLVGAILEARGQ